MAKQVIIKIGSKTNTYDLYKQLGEGSINPQVAYALKKKGGQVLSIPSGVAYDKKRKKFIKMKTNKGNFSPTMKKIIMKNPNDLFISKDDVIIDRDGRFEIDKASIFLKGNGVIKGAISKKGYIPLSQGNNRILQHLTKIENKKKKGVALSGKESVFYKPKSKNQGQSVFQIYNYFSDVPTDIEQFIAEIKASYETDFSKKDRTRPNQKVLLTFGDGKTEFRWFPLENIDDLVFMVEQYNFSEGTNWGGSDPKMIDGTTLISLENLDMSYFRISLSGSPFAGANGDEVAYSQYFFLNQPKTSNNECLEGAIKRHLGMKERTATIRKTMNEICDSIKIGDMISFDLLPYYEDYFELRIDIYCDKPHFKNGVADFNLIRNSVKTYDDTMKLLYKDEHFLLIRKNKKVVSKISRADCRLLGIAKDGYKSVVELLTPKEKKGLTEIAVIFDNETVFDRFDDQFLKVYGVSWFVWDFKDDFNYESGWNEDRTDNKYHHEPYCYYENGEDCEDKLIKFLLNPPNGKIYKPMGFNNSRFDNFSFCESAKKFNVLTDVFMCNGSILKCSIEGIKSLWDASRFLIGQSLDGACKSYDTTPKKQKDLINHYEIQCYYESNGMEGLVKLLNKKVEYILYNKFDVLSLCDLIQKMRNSYMSLFAEDIFEYLTISSYGYKVLCNTWEGTKENNKALQVKYQLEYEEAKKNKDRMKVKSLNTIIKKQQDEFENKHLIYKAKNYGEDKFYRDALTAGRCQSFYGKIDLSMPIAMCDVKSLYPTIMGSYDNDCPMPYGSAIPRSATEGYKEGKLGIYRCNIKHQRCKWKNQSKMFEAFKRVQNETGKNLYKKYAPNVIARREDDKPLDWFYKGEINNVNLTSVDIDVLRWATEDDDCVEVLNGYYWTEKSTELFKDFLDPPKQEKTRQDKLKAQGSSEYNNAIREGCKGISNAVSGKVIEQIHANVSKPFNTKNWNIMEQDEKIYALEVQDFGCGISLITGLKNPKDVFNDMDEDKKKPSYLGVFIYAYSRKLMYQKLLSKYLCLYMDTDSACMPLFEWDRCKQENLKTGLIETGEYGCLEEEVCYTDKNGVMTPANRLIGIAPKNYAVLNEEFEFMSKRKMKGVRKTDMWCPLSQFGDWDFNADGKLVGSAVDKIRGNNNLNIKKLESNTTCLECAEAKKNIRPAYSTEMFEVLCRGEKICVFASMIERIKYRVGEDTSIELLEKLGNEMSVDELESIVLGVGEMKIAYQFTITSKNMKVWKEQKLKFKEQNPLMDDRELKKHFSTFFNRFRKIKDEKELKDMFKLKQSYMVKII